MRNLKKILALVLALIMSLSLMATAGATDFSDDGNVTDTYRQAVEVLSDLGVFNGDQNGLFNPEKPITRAEVAAIIYRIATGDVTNERNDAYTPYNQFPDVIAGDWYAGYVTYCANAGYIKGRSDGKFDPKANVTGYEVLAMILRAVGYDKNNEFVGSNWQQNTASLATQKGVLQNIDNATSLKAAATRETVAELLFRAILLPQVTWNYASLSYDPNRETLAKANLGMERITGVVIANEWADLRDGDVTSAGQTVLDTADGERTLNVSTDLTDIGESRYAYVKINGETNRVDAVLGQLEDTGANVTKDCVDLSPEGKGITVRGLAGSLDVKDAHYFQNFGDVTSDTSDFRIEYSVSFRDDDAKEWFETKYLGQTRNTDDYDLEDDAVLNGKVNEELTMTGKYYDKDDKDTFLGLTFSRVIPAGDKISDLDKAIMQGIFGSAASFDSAHEDFSKLSEDIVHTGYVYAGTKSNPNTADRKDDLSDDMTYNQFAEKYINTDPTKPFNGSTNGVWEKVVDNNNDGKADYVFKTIYALVEVDGYNSREDSYSFTNGMDTEDWDVIPRDSEYEFAVGDMLLLAYIDGQVVAEEAEIREVVIEKYSWKDLSVTTTEGEVYYESGADIANTTGYADQIDVMEYGVRYQIILDHYGFIRAYRPIGGDRSYGLLTDMYLTPSRNTHYISSETATVELWNIEENEDGKTKLVGDEYDVANHGIGTWANGKDGNVFVGIKQYTNTNNTKTDNLQRAIAHLGLMNSATVTQNAVVDQYENAATILGAEFDYDAKANNNTYYGDSNGVGANKNNNKVDAEEAIDFTWTNIARYTMNEDGTVNLMGAAEYAYNKANEQLYYWKGATALVDDANAVVGGTRATLNDWAKAYAEVNGGKASDKAVVDAVKANTAYVYAVDYVMLKNVAISKNYRFEIDPSYNDGSNLYNKHLNTTNDTLFYLVTPNAVSYYVGYKNLPSIAADKVQHIYALAQNVTQDKSGVDYWVGNIVVIEADGIDTSTTYNWLVYNLFDNYRSGQRAVNHNLDVIDCATGEQITVDVADNWGFPYGTGFYLLENAKYVDDDKTAMTADSIVAFEDVLNPKDEASCLDWARTYEKYGKWSVMAGEVVRSNAVESRGGYIEVFDQVTDKALDMDELRVDTYGAIWYSVYAGTAAAAANRTSHFYADILAPKDYSENWPNGDEVIWVSYDGDVIFIIDTSFDKLGYTPDYLYDVYEICRDQQTYYGSRNTITVKQLIADAEALLATGKDGAIDYDKLVAMIEALEKELKGDRATAAQGVTISALIDELKAELDASKAAAVKAAQAAAVKAAEALAGDAAVDEVLDALKAEINACEDLDALRAIAKGDWTKNAKIKSAYEALVKAIEDADKSAAAAKALKDAKAQATHAVVEMLGDYVSYEGVHAAYAALYTAIDGAKTMEALNAIYKAGALVADNDLVKAFVEAVEAAEEAVEAGEMPEGYTIEGVTYITLAGDVTADAIQWYGYDGYYPGEVVIDLNGKTLNLNNANGTGLLIGKNGVVTIKNGTLTTSVNRGKTAALVAAQDNSTLTLEDVVIDATNERTLAGVLVGGNSNKAAEVSLTIKNSTITGGTFGLTVNGEALNGKHSVTIEGSTIASVASTGMYMGGNSKTSVRNSTIVGGGESGVEVRAGNVTLTNCKISGEGDPYGVLPNGAGTTTVGAALAVAPHVTGVDIDVVVSGGELVGSPAVSVANPNNQSSAVKVTVLSATLKTADGTEGWVVNDHPNAQVTVNGKDY